jgi:hypothetical protein
MISFEDTKKYLAELNLTDIQVEEFRLAAYSIVTEIIDGIYETNDKN